MVEISDLLGWVVVSLGLTPAGARVPLETTLLSGPPTSEQLQQSNIHHWTQALESTANFYHMFLNKKVLICITKLKMRTA